MREQNGKLTASSKEAQEKKSRANEELTRYLKAESLLDAKRVERDSNQKHANELSRYTKLLQESDEWLHSTLDQYEQRMEEMKQEEQSHLRRHEQFGRDIDITRNSLGAKQSERGKFEGEKAEFERQLERQEKLIKEAGRRHGIRGYEDSLDEVQVEEFMFRIQKASKEQHQALDRARRANRDELQQAQSALDQLRQRKTTLDESKRSAKQQIAANDKQMNVFQADVGKVETDEGTKVSLENTIKDVEDRLSKARQTAEAASWDKKIADMKSELRSYEDESSRLNADLIEGTKRAGDLARLDHLQKHLKENQQKLDTMVGVHGARLSELMGQDWEPPSLEAKFQSVVDQKNSKLRNAEQERDAVNRELEQVEFKLKSNRSDLKRKKNTLQDLAIQIREAIDDEPTEYEEILAQRQGTYDFSKDEAGNFTGLRDYFENCLNTARDMKACRTCKRAFTKDNEVAAFNQRMQNLIDKAAREAQDGELQQAEESLKAARNAGPSYATWARLSKDEIPDIEKDITSLQKQRDEVLAQIDDHDKLVRINQESKQDVESLSKTVQTMARNVGEITSTEHQIQELTLKQKDTGSNRTLEDINDQLKALSEKSRSVKQKIDKLNTEREQSRADINKLELELRDVRGKLTTATYQLEKRQNLLSRIEEIKALNRQQLEAIENADKSIQGLAPETSRAEAKYNDIAARADSREKELQQEAAGLSETVNSLDLANDGIQAYKSRGGPNQLARSEREIRACEEEIERLGEEQKRTAAEVNSIRTKLSNHEETKRTISDNVRYREALANLRHLNQEIEEFESNYADVDKGRLEKEVNYWNNKDIRNQAELAGNLGEMKQKDNQLGELMEDWDSGFKNAAMEFKESHIKVETTKAAVEDLGRYANALDKAIMAYHSLKMEEINRIIEELWQRTYQGTDVDAISIRSDNENAKSRSNYNYRVVMMKQDVEMDMRGRCSAGQKVLASIIIRLALAECFGVNCGLIALDEPTTNLDRDNITSLAASLNWIIKSRMQQRNFQLIVITHDEEFLKAMQCSDFIDHYWRVSRNERMKSIIEKNSVAEVSALFLCPLHISLLPCSRCLLPLSCLQSLVLQACSLTTLSIVDHVSATKNPAMYPI